VDVRRRRWGGVMKRVLWSWAWLCSSSGSMIKTIGAQKNFCE
jgi:hypothetical protein